MEKQWERIEYSKQGLLVAYEVVPVQDLMQHISDPNCPCFPRYNEGGDPSSLIHNSFDNRESKETGKRLDN